MKNTAYHAGWMPQLLDIFGMPDAIPGITDLTDKRIVFGFSKRIIRVELQSGTGLFPLRWIEQQGNL